MSMNLFVDCETTGLPSAGFEPWPVEVAALLVNKRNEPVGRFQAVVRPEGWSIPEDVVQLHGIDTGYASRYGMPLPAVLNVLAAYAGASSTVLGWNVAFDLGIVASACKRLNLPNPLALRSVCVMSECSRHLGLGRMSLGKAYEWVLKKPLAGAHTAMNDVNACRAIYAAITL